MASLPATYEFGDVRVDASSERVFRSGEFVPLEPKAFELLVYFIEHGGRLIEKGEILDVVWRETFVTENAMTRAVAQLRKALGDDAHEPKYIETVPRRGYRFLPDVRTVVAGARPPHGKKTLAVVGIGSAVLVALGVAVLEKSEGDKTRTLLPIQVTSSAALDIFPSMSPDGNAVAFSSNRHGRFEIYVKQLATAGKDIQLTSDGSQNFHPAWSPGGDVIAYHSKNRGGIWTVPALGGASRRLTDFGSRPAWSPDGRWVVFSSETLNDLGSNAATMPPSTLWIREIDGGPPRQLTEVGEPPGGHGNPAWSPQGGRIAFAASDTNFSELWTVSLEGELELVPVLGLGVYDFVYSPSGDELYVTNDLGGSFGLWSLDLKRKDAEPRLVSRTVSSAMRSPSFSADGKKLAYAGVLTSSNLASVHVSPETHEPVGPPRPLTHYTNQRNYHPRFSPDGGTVAFERLIAGAASDVWLIDADGRNERRLTMHPWQESAPWWSPDGKHVIFFARREGYGLGYWLIDVDSGEEGFLRSRPSDWAMVALSRDAKRVAFNSRKNGGVINVWIGSMAADGTDEGKERQLTFDLEMMGFPSWSPDGELIALEMKHGNDTHVGFVPSRGGTPVQLTNEPGQSWTGAWSPDGDKIAFASRRNDVWNLRWVSRTDKRESQLTDYGSLNTFVRYPSWSPKGDQIVYEYAETTGDIWILELP